MAGGLFTRLFGKRERPPERRGRRPVREDYKGPEMEQVRERDNESLLLDHHFIYPPEGTIPKHIAGMEYLVSVENTTDYPMGNIRVEFKKGSPLGKFGEPKVEKKLLDPSERMSVKVPFVPTYEMGKDTFQFELSFFDFKYKVDERIRLDTEPLKVSTPRFTGMEVDETTYQFLTADLYRWTLETGEVHQSPKDLYEQFKEKLVEMGFKQVNELLNEKQFRGICQMVAKDQKGKKWAAQAQVIGTPKVSKVLLYTYAERPQGAYSLASRIVSKMEMKESIVKTIIH